jgi:hypothetical protein
MAIFAKRSLAALFTVASLGLPATADSFSASAGVYKFRNTSQDPFWRVQNQIAGSTDASVEATWIMPPNEWGTAASGIASATAEPGRVEATGVANTNYPAGGTTASGSAWTDDFLVQHRDGLTDPGYVFGYIRITVTFETQISLVNMLPWNNIFNAARIDWSVLTRDMTDGTESGWAVRAGDGTNNGSPWPVVGKKFYDIPVSFAVGRPMAVNLSLKNEVQVLSNSGGQGTVFSIGRLELGQSPDDCRICPKSAAARLAVILPPEYRADSVKWGIVDGMYTPPGAVPCPADLDDSGTVDTGDIALLLLSFGDCDSGAPGCSGDLDDSGSVDTGDISMLLLDMGPCP